ncbi:MAG: hypothetical protein HOV81_32235 [Kofleriaceae bacterium]|nr:hypothetical protein [Kofleriaceae bacterium]
MKSPTCHLALLLVLVACGPGARREPQGDDDVGPDAALPYGPEGSPETCADGFDNEGDGVADCADSDCSGVGECPVCGDVDVPEAQPLLLPDGISSGGGCTTNAQCGGGTPDCIVSPELPNGGECHASYTSTLAWSGFPTNSLLTDVSKLQKICVNIEHSWIRDIEIDLITPDNRTFHLLKFWKRGAPTGDVTELYLGNAKDGDNSGPGVGETYCFLPTAMYEMIDSTGHLAPSRAAATTDGRPTLAAGDYKPNSPWNDLLNVPLNGNWTMRVTDLWGIDDGYLFSWSMTFDPSLIVDCTGPIVL